ncbi:MAG: hypothetical protein WD627_01195 [Actinomycetota bacterium]
MADLDLDSLVLEAGRHSRAEVGMSVLEAVTVVSNEKFSDSPRTVSKVIEVFLRVWNDALEDEQRQDLKPYIHKVINSVLTDDVEEHRAWQATDWLVRVQATAWLKAAGLDELAEAIASSQPLWGPEEARKAQKLVDIALAQVHSEATTGAEAWTQAGEEAWAQVSPKTWDSVGNGIKAAVRSATGRGHVAALAAADGTGKRYAARDAAFETACDVAWDSAYMIAWKVAVPLGAFKTGEATNAVREALEPTAGSLYPLTFDLLDLMIQTRRVPDEVVRDVDRVGS